MDKIEKYCPKCLKQVELVKPNWIKGNSNKMLCSICSTAIYVGRKDRIQAINNAGGCYTK